MKRILVALAAAGLAVAAAAAPAPDKTKGLLPGLGLVRGRQGPGPDARDRDPALPRGLEKGRRPDQAAGLQHRPDLDRVDGLREDRRPLRLLGPRAPDRPGRRSGPPGHRPGLHRLGARLGRGPAPRFQVRLVERRRRRIAGLARVLLRPRRGPGEDPRFLQGRGPRPQGQAGLLRLGPLERAPHHQLGRGLLRRRPQIGPVLLLSFDPGPLPGMARKEIRDDRGPEQGLVPHPLVVGGGRAAALRHHPDLHRLHRLEGIHLRQAGRGPGDEGRGRQVGPARFGRHQPLGRAGPLHPAGLVGDARRPQDVGQRRFLRRFDLPQARLDDQALVADLPVLGPRLRPVHGPRERRLLYRRAPGRLRRLRHEDELPGRRHGHARLDVEHGRLRRARGQHLRLLSHEHRLRGRRLRPGRARRQGHRAGRGRRPDRPHHHREPGPLSEGASGASRDRHPL